MSAAAKVTAFPPLTVTLDAHPLTDVAGVEAERHADRQLAEGRGRDGGVRQQLGVLAHLDVVDLQRVAGRDEVARDDQRLGRNGSLRRSSSSIAVAAAAMENGPKPRNSSARLVEALRNERGTTRAVGLANYSCRVLRSGAMRGSCIVRA